MDNISVLTEFFIWWLHLADFCPVLLCSCTLCAQSVSRCHCDIRKCHTDCLGCVARCSSGDQCWWFSIATAIFSLSIWKGHTGQKATSPPFLRCLRRSLLINYPASLYPESLRLFLCVGLQYVFIIKRSAASRSTAAMQTTLSALAWV